MRDVRSHGPEYEDYGFWNVVLWSLVPKDILSPSSGQKRKPREKSVPDIEKRAQELDLWDRQKHMVALRKAVYKHVTQKTHNHKRLYRGLI